MAKNQDFQNFISMQILFRNKASHINFLKAMSGIEELQNHISEDIINSEAEYVDLIDDIVEEITTSNVFGKYKN